MSFEPSSAPPMYYPVATSNNPLGTVIDFVKNPVNDASLILGLFVLIQVIKNGLNRSNLEYLGGPIIVLLLINSKEKSVTLLWLVVLYAVWMLVVSWFV